MQHSETTFRGAPPTPPPEKGDQVSGTTRWKRIGGQRVGLILGGRGKRELGRKKLLEKKNSEDRSDRGKDNGGFGGGGGPQRDEDLAEESKGPGGK